MVEITNREELEAWLEDKPREVAVAIAARAAFRSLPFLSRLIGKWPEQRNLDDDLTSWLRCSLTSGVAGTWPTPEVSNASAAASASASASASALLLLLLLLMLLLMLLMLLLLLLLLLLLMMLFGPRLLGIALFSKRITINPKTLWRFFFGLVIFRTQFGTLSPSFSIT